MTKFIIKALFNLIFLLSTVGFANPLNLKFDHFTIDNGLSSNNVNCIFQDSRGFMWFGTENGIDKYDGYSFFNYNHDPRDSLTLSDNWVTDIQEDKYGNLWIATDNGLNRFDRSTGKFKHFFNEKKNPNSLCANRIKALHIDKENTVWIGMAQGLDKLSIEQKNKHNEPYIFKHYQIDTTQQNSNRNNINVIYEDHVGLLWIGTMGGLFSFDKNSEIFTPHLYDPENPNSISGNHIKSIYEDKNHNLWIGTWHVFKSGSLVPDRSGLLNKYNKKTNQFTRYQKNEDPYCISHVSSIVEDHSGNLWFGALENHGLYEYEEHSDQFKRFGHFQNNPHSISSNFVQDLYTDKTGILWIATWHGGISKYDPNKEKFKRFEHLPGVKNTLHFDKVTKIIEDSFGKVWIGTFGNKIGFYNLKTGLFDKYERYQYYGPPVKDTKNLSTPYILDILEDKSKNIWIGTTVGLNKYDRTTKTYKKYFAKPGDPNNPNFISNSYANCLLQDRYGFLWIGTSNGLNRMDIEGETFKHYFNDINDSTTINHNFISSIYEDREGDLWFGSFGKGLNLYDRNNDQFKRYFNDPSDKTSLSDDRVTVIADDQSGNIWIGTMMGLNKLDKTTQKITLYTTKDGLCSNFIVGILEDNSGCLWISTRNGLSKFDPHIQKFRNYDVSDGLQSNEFTKLSYHKGRSGRFYFGGVNGFNMFYPDSIKDNSNIPPVLITAINISNQPAKLDQSIFETKSIKLSYLENDISFTFVALNYTNTYKNQYAYRLEGYHDSWDYCGTQRFANFTNLDPGEYTFHVRGSNNDGIWNEHGASIDIIITPPWWKTQLAYIFYFVFFISLVVVIWRAQVRRIQLRQQLKMEHFKGEKLREIDTMKSHFFANISHEFRTPLTLILSPVEQLIADTYKGNIKEGYVTIRSNARKLLRLVNQLLSLAKMDAGQIKLQVSEQDIIPVFKRIIHSFASLAERKNIHLNFSSPKSLTMYFDEEKIETIVNNLLSNAFKYTPEGGDVEVAVEVPNSPDQKSLPPGFKKLKIPNSEFLILNSNCIAISISNTGPGIPGDQLNKIFDRFYQMESHTHHEGTGIGLSLTKDFVELHHGQIEVESKAGKYTVFTILIPADEDSYNSDEIVQQGADHKRIEENESAFDLPEMVTHKTPIKELPKVLIVEDNEEMRDYLRKNFEERYNIIEAPDGKIGIQKAQKEMPEIIISDVMMPRMDGIEFCDQIKSEVTTNHIPVILLTARSAREDKLEGLKTGADDYLAKPFDLEELSIRIQNLIQQRRALKERFSREALFGLDNIIFHRAEEEFIEKITQIINHSIDNVEYTVNNFARDVGMSRAQLFRKVKAWTNQTPQDFIRLCRLKKAAMLLKHETQNVTEVAFAVGFKNASHFIRSFKNQFGRTPKEFLKS